MRKLITAALVALAAMAMPAVAQWSERPETKQLYEKARKEGRVILWGPSRGEVEWVARAFPQAFPGIEVQFVGDNDVVTRAIAEARGGRHQVDVMWNSVTASVPLIDRKLIAETDWKGLGVDKPQTGFDGRMLYVSKALYSIAFDPKRVREEELPKTWDAFLDRKFKGRMAASLFLLPRLTGGLALAWGEDKALDWARQLVNEQDVLLTRAPRETFIESGERQLALGEIESLYRRHEVEGKVFGLIIPEPVVMVQFGLLVMREAPNSNAARLLSAWMATSEAREARRKLTGANDYNPDSKHPLAVSIYAGKTKAVFDLPDNMKERDAAIRKATPIVAGRAK